MTASFQRRATSRCWGDWGVGGALDGAHDFCRVTTDVAAGIGRSATQLADGSCLNRRPGAESRRSVGAGGRQRVDDGGMPAPALDQILPLLGENTVLGLGEPTHGSANAFAWKLEILAELARRGTLAAFAIEDSLIAGRLLDQVLRAEGDVDEYLAAGSSIWRTTTIRDGLKRLAEITAEAPPEARPRGLGIDISAPHRTAGALLELGH